MQFGALLEVSFSIVLSGCMLKGTTYSAIPYADLVCSSSVCVSLLAILYMPHMEHSGGAVNIAVI